MCELMDLTIHTVSSDNHGSMLVERVNRYLNKCFKTFSNKVGTLAVRCDDILLLLHTWSLCLILITDIICMVYDCCLTRILVPY